MFSKLQGVSVNLLSVVIELFLAVIEFTAR